MYHYELVIHILSTSVLLQEALANVPAPAHFSFRFRCFSGVCDESLTGCNLLLLDLPAGDILRAMPRIASGTNLILCSEPEDICLLQEAAADLCADFWVKPFSSSFAAARFNRLLEHLRLEKDDLFIRTCLNTTINSIPDLIWFKDLQGSHEMVNDAFCHAVGKTKQDIQGRGHYYIWDLEPEEYATGEYVCLETEEEVLRQRKTCLFDEKVKSSHGLRQFKTYKSPIFDDTGEVIGTVGIAHDVTVLENISTELDILLNSMPFAILVKNDKGIIINSNEKFSEYFQMPREQVQGKYYEEWKKDALNTLTGINEEGYAEAALNIGGKDKIFEIHEEPIYDIFENLVGQLCICRDITVERTLEQQILQTSITDFLTGLYNRRGFYDYISRNRGNQTVSLIYLDLDHFKNVNDVYGHQAGDEALILVSRLMKECFPHTLIARLGGDEFLITLLGACDIRKLLDQSQLLLDKMQLAFRQSRQLNSLTASIGIAQTNDPGLPIDTLIYQSDQALYFAKQHGRARCCLYSDV